MTFLIRRLAAADAADYRVLRIEALRNEPGVFADDHDAASARPMEYWTDLFSGDRAFFGAHDNGALCGSINFMRDKGPVVRHKGWLLGMYVAPAARGTGTADALVETLVKHAADEGVLQLQLGVSTGNETALRLYERHGFSTYGREPRALRFADSFVDQFMMVKCLDGEA